MECQGLCSFVYGKEVKIKRRVKDRPGNETINEPLCGQAMVLESSSMEGFRGFILRLE